MNTTTDTEHLEWAKRRALYYITQDRTDCTNALASILADLNKADPAIIDADTIANLTLDGCHLITVGDVAGMRLLIESIGA